jgi:hypothetical protein
MSEEDIQILIDQTTISRELAKKLIIYKGGDLVECILELENTKDLDELESKINNKKLVHRNDDSEKDVDTSKRENLEEYRSVIDEKDTIYNYKSEMKAKRKEKAKLLQEKKERGESTEDLEDKKLCNEALYYSFRKNNINNIKVL